MKILSIDVGIVNFACCLFSYEPGALPQICKWDVLNINAGGSGGTNGKVTGEVSLSLCNKPKQAKRNTPIQLCGKPALYKADTCYRCAVHAKKEQYLMPSNDLVPAQIAKCTMLQLCALANKYQVAYTMPIKKTALAALLCQYAASHCFQYVEPDAWTKTGVRKPAPKAPNARKTNLVIIGRNLRLKLDQFLEGHKVDAVVIENQITSRMKCVQSMAAQYFIMCCPNAHVDFLSAIHKLETGDEEEQKPPAYKTADIALSDDVELYGDGDDDAFDVSEMVETTKKAKKRTYDDRKAVGIKYCINEIGVCCGGSGTTEAQQWTNFLATHKKQDDLADCYLQGKWYIMNKVHSVGCGRKK